MALHRGSEFIRVGQSVSATGIIHQGVTDSLLQNSPSFHRANIFILGFKRPRYDRRE